jgi:putative endonuclease
LGDGGKWEYMKAHVYIIANKNNTALYTGVSSDLKERINQHKDKKHHGSFTSKYNANKLVYFECFSSIGDAIKREKQIKAGSRKKKMELINRTNPGWDDLSLTLES